MDATLLVVGAGLAGANAATAARDRGFDGRVVLLGADPEIPYERPPLSKDVLRGEAPLASAFVHDASFYDERSIEVVTGTEVIRIDTAARRVDLSDGASMRYTSLVLATGSRPRRLHVRGGDLPGVHYLRTMADAAHLRPALGAGARVVVVGAGWIGSEVAASARAVGADVCLVDPSPVPLAKVLGTSIGTVLRDLHADHGVTLRLGTTVTELQGARSVEKVLLADGRAEAADVVVVGIGVTPCDELARTAGLHVADGVVVDEHLHATAPDVFAAGDVARAWHPHYRTHLRVEHWANARHQGMAAGANAVGAHTAYLRLPYFYSDQYDLSLEYVGYAGADDAVAIRGSLADREFVAFYAAAGRVTAAVAVNVPDATGDLERIVGGETPIGTAGLLDPAVPLAGLATA